MQVRWIHMIAALPYRLLSKHSKAAVSFQNRGQVWVGSLGGIQFMCKYLEVPTYVILST